MNVGTERLPNPAGGVQFVTSSFDIVTLTHRLLRSDQVKLFLAYLFVAVAMLLDLNPVEPINLAKVSAPEAPVDAVRQ